MKLFVHHAVDNVFDVTRMRVAGNIIDGGFVYNVVRRVTCLHDKSQTPFRRLQKLDVTVTHLHDVERSTHIAFAESQQCLLPIRRELHLLSINDGVQAPFNLDDG